MAAGLALLLAAALGAGVRIEPGIRTEALVRRIDPPPSPAEKDALNLTANPTLAVTVSGGAGLASIRYDPTFTATDVGPDLRWQHLHQGEARVRLGMRPTWNVQGFGSGSIGRTDLITVNRVAGGTGGTGPAGGTGGTSGVPGTGTTTISSVQTLDLMQWRAGMSLQLAPDRRTSLLLAAALSEDGGSNARSRLARPVARGGDASAQLDRSVSRLDQVGLSATALQTRIAALHVDASVETLMATWRRNLTPQVQLTTGAGATAFQSRILRSALDPRLRRQSQRLYSPAGQLGIAKVARVPIQTQGQTAPPPATPGDQGQAAPTESTTTGSPTQAEAQVLALAAPGRSRLTDATGSLVATLGGTVDRTSGVATPSFDLVGNLRWPVVGNVSVFTDASGSLFWPKGGRRTRRGQADLGASFPIGPQISLDVGSYGSWQRSEDPTVPNVKEYGAFVRIGLSARPLTY